MAKTMYEILAEKDGNYTYRIHSTANIHDPDRFERIKLEFMPFVLKAIECESYKPLSKANTMFPEQPNSPTFTVKAITRYTVTKGFLETLAWAVRVDIAHLRIEPEGDEYDPVNKPGEVSPADSQKTVGTKRIGDFIKELQQERKDREDMTWRREVYENFFTTHRGLQGVIKKPVRNGYYMVEAYTEGGKKYLYAKGPYESRSEENPYHDRIRVKNSQLISETTKDGLYSVQVLVD